MNNLNNYECDGQLTLDDYKIVVNNNGYAAFNSHCIHRGWYKGATETEPAIYMCSYANGVTAKTWADWIPCKECNCFILKEKSNE